MKWPWKANKELIKNLQNENVKLKEDIAIIQSKQSVSKLEETAPRSIIKDYKQDATQFIQECIENPLISQLPSGYYYYTGSLISHGNVLNVAGCTFYTDKDVPFLYARGENNQIGGFGKVDVSDVKEPTGQAVIYLQHKSDHHGQGIYEFRIESSIEQIRTTLGFNGIEFKGDEKYPTSYKNGNYEMGEAHRNTIKVYSRYLNKAVNMPKGGYSKTSNDIYIIDHFSKMALNNEAGGVCNLWIDYEDRAVLTEEEQETPMIYLGASQQNIWKLRGEVGVTPAVVDGITYYGHKTVMVNDGDNNILFDANGSKWMLNYGKVVQNKPLIIK